MGEPIPASSDAIRYWGEVTKVDLENDEVRITVLVTRTAALEYRALIGKGPIVRVAFPAPEGPRGGSDG